MRAVKASSIAQLVGNTPLVRINRLGSGANKIYGKLEGTNPGGSVKDRPALMMIQSALERGDIKAGDQLVEATSGNTGIALAMVAAAFDLKMRLIMPANQTEERKASMRSYGAELILVTKEEGMEGARDLALKMSAEGEGIILNQFDNPDNPKAHIKTTGPEIWEATEGRITHFVSSMGTTGTISGCGRYFREKAPGKVTVVGVQPAEGSSIPGIRKWPKEYTPKIFNSEVVDQYIEVNEEQAKATMRDLAATEGISAGVSSGGALWAALQIDSHVKDAVIVFIICDRGDRYLSTGVFSQ